MNIEHFTGKGLFETIIEGKTAYVSYQIENRTLDIRHTIVPKELEGRGIASALVKEAYDYALAHHLKPVATCSYAVAWLKRHPEYLGENGKDYAGEGTCAL